MIAYYQTSVDVTFSRGEYYTLAPIQEENHTDIQFAKEIYWYSQDYRTYNSVARAPKPVTENVHILPSTSTLVKMPKKKRGGRMYYYICCRMKTLLCELQKKHSASCSCYNSNDDKPAAAKKNT